MDLEFTEEQEMLREMVRGVCSSYASLATVREVEDDRSDTRSSSGSSSGHST